MRQRRWIALLAVVALLGILTVACQPQVVETVKEVPVTVEVQASVKSTFDRIKGDGIVRLGFANEKPFGHANPDGTLTGESPEVAKAIFTALGVTQVEGVLTEFGALIPGLKAGRFDAITAGMYIKPERCEEVLFSEPDYGIGSALAVTKGNPLNLHSYEDVAANPDAKIGVMAGAYEYDYAIASGVPKDRIVSFPTGPDGIAGLQAGRVDAFTLTSLSIQSLLENAADAGLERAVPFTDPIVDGKTTRGYGGVAFRKEDKALRDAYNAELQKLKDSGELLKILEPFGFTAAELPDASTKDLCGDAYQ